MWYGAGSAELIFHYFLESDPEYQKPDLKPEPDVSVEIFHRGVLGTA
jgi:hypothetical protein